MHIRPIAASELAVFTRAFAAAESNAFFRDDLAEKWQGGRSRPEWCFVAEREGRIIGRIVYETSAPEAPRPTPQIMGYLGLEWGGDYLDVGRRLVGETLAAVSKGGAIKKTLYSAQEGFAETRQVLEGLGMAAANSYYIFLRQGDRPVNPGVGQLVFRPLGEEVEEGDFIKAIAAVSRGALDRRVREGVEQLGALKWAEGEWARAQRNFIFARPWWQMASDAEGEAVGFVLPALWPDDWRGGLGQGTMRYVGILPAQRGKGYINSLIARALETLQGAGIWQMEDHVDESNLPMIGALRRAGYEESTAVCELVGDIESLTGS